MVQVIGPGTPRGPSTGKQLASGINSVLGAYNEYKQNAAQQKAIAQQFPELANLPPEMQKAAIPQLLKGRQGQQQIAQKQDYLNQLFGGQGQGQQGGMGQQLQQGGNEQSGGQGMPQGFDASSIPDEVIARAAAVDPNMARSLQHAKDVALREKSAEKSRNFEREKFEEQQRKASPEYQREHKVTEAQASSDVKYNQELQAGARQHELKEQTLNKLEELNRKGVTGKPYEKLLEKMGLTALTSTGRREFAADTKNLITDIKSILGGQFSQFEFQTILNAYPSADFSKDANAAIIRNLKDFQEIKSKEVEFANKLKKENKGKIPEDFQTKVNEMVHEFALSKLPQMKENARKIMNEEYGISKGNVLMFDPQGEPLNVSPQDMERFQSLGATLP